MPNPDPFEGVFAAAGPSTTDVSTPIPSPLFRKAAAADAQVEEFIKHEYGVDKPRVEVIRIPRR